MQLFIHRKQLFQRFIYHNLFTEKVKMESSTLNLLLPEAMSRHELAEHLQKVKEDWKMS